MEPRGGTSTLAEANDLLAGAVKLRRQIHRNPEIGLANPRTQETIIDAIDGLDLAITTGRETTSVIAVLEGDRPGPTVLLRADMDALPMPEDADLSFRSTTDGVMHACGHDLHVSMLAGAARLLHSRRRELAGRVLFMFQPGEEGYGGADVMLNEGLLQAAPDIKSAFALHVVTSAPSGVATLKGGPIMASSDKIAVRVMGRGGHASAPHFTLDPIPVACEIVQAFQTMITRKVDVFDPAVVTIAQIVAGTTSNVIPEHADILGTIRAVSERTRKLVHTELLRVADGIAAAHGATAEASIELGYPVTVNDTDFASFATSVASDLLGADKVRQMPFPVMGAEDFSYILNRVPGSMVFLGATPHGVDPRTAAPNHSNRVMFDEETMTTGIALYASMALNALK